MLGKPTKLSGAPKSTYSTSDANYQNINRLNRMNAKAGAIAAAKEYSAKQLYKLSDQYKHELAMADVDNQIAAFRTAVAEVEKYDNYLSKYKGNVDQFKSHIAEFIVDGRLPGVSDDYDKCVQEWGQFVIERNKSELDTKTERNVK